MQTLLVAAVILAEASFVQALAAASSARASPSLTFVPPAKRLPPSPSASSSFSRNYAADNRCLLSTNRSSRCISYALLDDRRHQHSRRRTELHATIDDDALQTDIVERLELTDQFERWSFLQKLLEGELPASDIEDVLLLSLNAYLQHGPTAQSANNKDENGGNASPVLTADQKSAMGGVIDDMLSASDGIGDSRFLHMLVLPPVDYESIVIDNEDVPSDDEDERAEVDPGALATLEGIEQLLPDPVEDEEAFKGAWDIIIDLYGRESVRVREEALQREKESDIGIGSSGDLECSTENLQWRTLCAVGRVLIHYDFLTKGVLTEGTFQ